MKYIGMTPDKPQRPTKPSKVKSVWNFITHLVVGLLVLFVFAFCAFLVGQAAHQTSELTVVIGLVFGGIYLAHQSEVRKRNAIMKRQITKQMIDDGLITKEHHKFGDDVRDDDDWRFR